ncbi:MAG: O-antigen ligase family protein [Paramuribaculum sp.]|nr:O-antigen ligase family protein [Paramuribaculum sp.]
MSKINRNINAPSVILALILCFGLWECGTGILQTFGFIASRHSLYSATGTFYNPGPYCAFLSIIIVIAAGCIISAKNRIMVWISWLYLTGAVFLLPGLMGRTGWIAAAAGCIYIFASVYRINLSGRRKVAAVISGVVLLAIICCGLFFLKPESATGRLFLWKIGAMTFADHFFTGIGWDNVSGAIGLTQENYFANHPGSAYESVAGCPEYAFNEYLQIGIAFGVIGLLIFVSLPACAAYCAQKARQFSITGALIASGVVCFASYPLQFSEFIALFGALCIAGFMSGNYPAKWMKYSFSALTLCLCLPAMFIYHGNTLSAQNHRLVFDYGKSLRERGLYEKSNEVLQQGVRISSDPMFLNLIGRNWQSLGSRDSAAHYFDRAANRLPGRLYPHYLKCKLLLDPRWCDPDSFLAVCDRVIEIRPKIESPATRDMKSELKALRDSIINIKEPCIK